LGKKWMQQHKHDAVEPETFVDERLSPTLGPVALPKKLAYDSILPLNLQEAVRDLHGRLQHLEK
jgi:hypothetical protein